MHFLTYDHLGKILLWISIIASLNCVMRCNCEADFSHFPPNLKNDICNEPDPIIEVLVALASNYPNFRIQSPSNRGNFQIQIQENKFTLNAGATSNRFGIRPTSGIYKIKSDTEGILLDQAAFDFSKSIRDGIIVRNEFNLDPDRCYLLDGVSGNAVEKDCADF